MRRSPPNSLNDAVMARLETGEIGAVLHYSRRSTEIFLESRPSRRSRYVAGQPRLHFKRCGSTALASGIHEVLIAKSPDEPAMLAIVNALAGLPEPPPLGPGEDTRS